MELLMLGLFSGFVAGMAASGFIVRHAWRDAASHSSLGRYSEKYNQYPPRLKDAKAPPKPSDARSSVMAPSYRSVPGTGRGVAVGPPEVTEFDSDTTLTTEWR